MVENKYPRILLQFTNDEHSPDNVNDSQQDWSKCENYDGAWRVVETRRLRFQIENRLLDSMKQPKWVMVTEDNPKWVIGLLRSMAKSSRTHRAVCDLLEGGGE